jgi:hypothetical protein
MVRKEEIVGSIKAKIIGCLIAFILIIVRLIERSYPWWLIVVYGFYVALGLFCYLIIWQALADDTDKK